MLWFVITNLNILTHYQFWIKKTSYFLCVGAMETQYIEQF